MNNEVLIKSERNKLYNNLEMSYQQSTKEMNLDEIYRDKNETDYAKGRNKDSINNSTNTLQKYIEKDSHQNSPFQSNVENNPDRTPSNIIYCKICYEEEKSEENKLITPCICEGTIKYIHQECLKTWIQEQDSLSLDNACCEICKTPYVMKFKLKDVYSREKCCKFTEKLSLLMAATAIILIVVDVLLYIVIIKSTESIEADNIVIGLVSASGLILILVFILSIKNYKLVCYEKVLDDWKILNLNEAMNPFIDNSQTKIIHYSTNVYINNFINY